MGLIGVLENDNRQLQGDINTAQQQIERLETAESKIKGKEPEFSDIKNDLNKRDLGDDVWRGDEKTIHENLRDLVEGKINYGLDHIERMLSDISSKKEQLRDNITSMQNTISSNESDISELEKVKEEM